MVVKRTKREIDQIIQVAKYYLSESERMHSCDPDVSNIAVPDVTIGHVLGQLKYEELLLAHLASCAIRLCTVWEIQKGDFPEDYRTKFYKNKSRQIGYTPAIIDKEIMQNLDDHIHFLLRDNIGHEENVKSHMAEDRTRILLKLTVGEILSAVNSSMKNTVSKIDDLINRGQITS